jgi:pimeloyl-ACP methyl ester carboxylesterase
LAGIVFLWIIRCKLGIHALKKDDSIPSKSVRADGDGTKPLTNALRVPPALHLLRVAGRIAPVPTARLAVRLFLYPHRPQRAAVDVSLLQTASTSPRIPFVSTHRGSSELQCYVWGDGPRAVLLAHGWSSYAGRMGGFVEPLVAAGYRVVAVDAPAHGASNGASTDLLDYAAALGTVRKTLGPFHSVIAHSLGAAAALWDVAESRDEAIERLVFIGAPSSVRFMIHIFADRLHLPVSVRNAMETEVLRRFNRGLDELDLTNLARHVAVPTLFIHDRLDNVVPITEGEALYRALPNTTFITTEGLRHSGTVRDAAVISSAVSFVSS